jgi:DNA-binding MarR family transcriptional regulator
MVSQAIRRPPKLAVAAGASARRPASTEVREVLNSLRHIVRSLRVSSRIAEQQVGLSGAQLFVLQCLAQHGPCSVNALAAHTATDQSSVSVVVSRLVARALVKRTASKLDRRSVQLSLAPAGKALLESAPKAVQDRLLTALTSLKKTELRQLSLLLHKLVELAEVPSGSPSLFFEEAPMLTLSKSRPSRGRTS